jgi:hypothetical protein
MTLTRWALLKAFTLFAIASLPLRAADFPPITPEELKMTSLPEQPGAPAVILMREEVDDDMHNLQAVHERIKILTEAGREYANVEIPYSRRSFTIGGVSGRTTHADGSVVPFEGKPFDKTLIKSGNFKVNVKSFTLPDVQVGSIIEYSYELRYDDRRVFAPEWEVQQELFQRRTYFKYIPFQNQGSMEVHLDHGQIASGVAWAPFLGVSKGPQVHRNQAAEASYVSSQGQATHWIDLDLDNVPAFVEEPYMPPPSMVRWRVYFYYQEKLKPEDYWKSQGKFWAKDVDSFISKDKGIAGALAQVIQPSDSPEQKVRKIYAYVAQMENQDYIPQRSEKETKVLQLKVNKGSEDVLANRSGTHDELNRLFVSMVRAAGVPASLIWVPDRSRELFLQQYLSTRQFDAEIAIVQLDGKDVYLDPGSKYCPFGILDWRYSAVGGLKLTSKGAEFGEVPAPTFKQSVTTRMADLSLDMTGAAHGKIVLVSKGIAAMLLRQEGGKTDADGRKKILEDDLRSMLPGNSEIELTNAPDWEGSEAPLTAEFKVSFPFAVLSGKRLLVQQHLFQVASRNRFPPAKRVNPVYFRFPWQEADEVHITVPAGVEVESLAPEEQVRLKYALYQTKQKQEAPGRLFSRRDFIMAENVILPNQYTEVKDFFDKVKAADDQPALLKVGANVASSN